MRQILADHLQAMVKSLRHNKLLTPRHVTGHCWPCRHHGRNTHVRHRRDTCFMRIGLAGAGRIGAFHASTLATLEDVEQVVVADALPATAERLAAENGYEFSAGLDDLLSRVDGFFIATSTTAHAST